MVKLKLYLIYPKIWAVTLEIHPGFNQSIYQQIYRRVRLHKKKLLIWIKHLPINFQKSSQCVITNYYMSHCLNAGCLCCDHNSRVQRVNLKPPSYTNHSTPVRLYRCPPRFLAPRLSQHTSSVGNDLCAVQTKREPRQRTEAWWANASITVRKSSFM